MTITFVGVGAAVTADNAATLNPPLNASTQAGDLVLILASIRNTAAFPSGVSGWTLVGGTENVRVFGKIAETGEPTPAVAFSGGVAGDDNIAQAATFRGTEPSLAGLVFNIQTNLTAVNLAYPAVTVPAINHLVIVAGWRQDDTTGIAPIAGYTEIGETNTITGNDAAQVWDYQIQTTATNLAAGSFVVTGLTAVSKGLTILVRPAASIAVTQQDVYPPRNLVTVTGLTLTDDVDIYRVVSGERTLLRGGSLDNTTDPSFFVIDNEYPFGVPVTYTAVVNDSPEYSAGPTTYTLANAKPVVTDAISGDAAEVIIQAWDQRNWSPQRSAYKVGGRNVVVSTGGLGMYDTDIEFIFEAPSSLTNFYNLLAEATEGVVQLRVPEGDMNDYFAVLGAREVRHSDDWSDPKTHLVLSVMQVEGWATALEAHGFTYADVETFYGSTTTYAMVESDFATWLAAEQGDYS